jgi:hypothetical protein
MIFHEKVSVLKGWRTDETHTVPDSVYINKITGRFSPVIPRLDRGIQDDILIVF